MRRVRLEAFDVLSALQAGPEEIAETQAKTAPRLNKGRAGGSHRRTARRAFHGQSSGSYLRYTAR